MAKKESKMAIIITIDNNGRVEVSGFPTHVGIATDIMSKAQTRVFDWFLERARQGKLKEDGTIEMNKIITPDKNIILPGGNA